MERRNLLLVIFLWSVFVCLSSLVYFVYGINRPSAILVVLAVFLLYWLVLRRWWVRKAKSDGSNLLSDKKDKLINEASWLNGRAGRAVVWFLWFYSLAVDVFLVVRIWLLRSDLAKQTPWTDVNQWFFYLFFVSSAVLIFLAIFQRSRKLFLVSALIHFLVFYGTALLFFRFGYGYDPIIHQTAENYIVGHGRIFPLQPFYVGQYALVTIFHFLTFLPVWLIDRSLLPLLAVISLPLIIFYIGQKAYKFSTAGAALLVVLFLVLPMAEFTFTVPYNLAALYAVWWIWLLPLGAEKRGRIILFLVALAAAATHVLIGVPLVLATLALSLFYFKPDWWQQKIKSFLVALFFILVIGLAIPLMFGIYRWRQNLPFFDDWFFWHRIGNFINVWRWPYSLKNISWLYILIYLFNAFWFYLVILGGLIALWKNRLLDYRLRLVTAVLFFGLAVAILFTSTLVIVPGVNSYEQNEFVLRLRHLLPVILLPSFLVGFFALFEKFFSRSWFLVGLVAVCSAIMTLAFYFNYPQVDAVANFSGWNVSKDDIVAVEKIRQDAAGYRFVILSDQISAVAALRELGFASRLTLLSGETIYPFATAPEELLYPASQKMLYEKIDSADIERIKKVTNARVYLVFHSYWFSSGAAREEVAVVKNRVIYESPEIIIWELQ